jgi:hypothetical protein
MSLPPIVARITADTRELSKGLGDASTRLKTFAKVGAAAATTVGAALIALTKVSMAQVDTQAKLAQSLGTTVSSIQTLARAGELAGVSMGGIQQATSDLTRRLSQAASGAGPAAEALNRLGLSARELASVPLDERVMLINEALDRFVPITERAAVAGQLFGEEGSLAMSRIDTATLRQATEDVHRFGVVVSEQDADQIEKANDAVSRLGVIMDGLGNTIAVKVAPTVERLATGVADLVIALFNLRTEAELMQERVSESFDDILDSASDAAQSLDDYAMALDAMMEIGAAEVVRRLASEMDNVRAKFEAGEISAQEMGEQMEAIRLRAVAIVEDLGQVNSLGFDNAIARLGALGTAIANAAIQARELAVSGGVASFPGKEKDDLATFSAPEDQPDIAPGISSGAAVKDQLAERLEALMEGLQTEAEAIAAWYAESDATLRDALAQRLMTEEEYREQRERLEEEHQNRLAAIREMGNRWGVEAALSGGAEILNAMGQTNKKALKVAQAFAAAEALVSTYKGAAKALEKGAFGFAEAAAVIAKGLSFVAAIRGVKAGGASPSGAGATGAAPSTEGGGGVSQNVAIQLVGGDMFSRSQVVTLINKINEAVEGGAKLRIV